MAADAARQTPSARQKADRLWNGVLIGASLGAVAGVVTGNATADCSECAGFNVPLTFGALGAGIGGVLGALIDAAHARSQSAPPWARYVRLSPKVSKRMFGLTATITFRRSARPALGTTRIHCAIHPNMTGTLTVREH
jgi:hypothetical protein